MVGNEYVDLYRIVVCLLMPHAGSADDVLGRLHAIKVRTALLGNSSHLKRSR
jgi:hypothetical protein